MGGGRLGSLGPVPAHEAGSAWPCSESSVSRSALRVGLSPGGGRAQSTLGQAQAPGPVAGRWPLNPWGMARSGTQGAGHHASHLIRHRLHAQSTARAHLPPSAPTLFPRPQVGTVATLSAQKETSVAHEGGEQALGLRVGVQAQTQRPRWPRQARSQHTPEQSQALPGPWGRQAEGQPWRAMLWAEVGGAGRRHILSNHGPLLGGASMTSSRKPSCLA